MLLDQKEAENLLDKYRIKYPKTTGRNFSGLSFPVVVKVDSPQVVHKTDHGLIATNMHNSKEVKDKIKEMEQILLKKKITEYNFIIQETVRGTEIIVGMKKDATFGPVIMFGLGGIFVEAMKDVSLRIAPLTKKDCEFMIDEIQGQKLLQGFRGLPKPNRDKMIELLMKISEMSLKEDLEEIDFNPVMVTDKDAIVVDARFIHA